MRLLHRLARHTRLTRLLGEHRTDEALRRAGMEETAEAIRAGRWDSPCGCSRTLPGADDPGWVPCEAHAERLWRMVHEDGEAL